MVVQPSVPWLLPEVGVDCTVKEELKGKSKGNSVSIVKEALLTKWADYMQTSLVGM